MALLALSVCLSVRDIRQPPLRHRDVLRHRAPLRLTLRLLEALLVAMERQRGRRPQPDSRAPPWRGGASRGRRRLLPPPPFIAEERHALLVLSLSVPGPGRPTPPTLLRPDGGGGRRGHDGGWGRGRASGNAGALLPGHGLLPEQRR